MKPFLCLWGRYFQTLYVEEDSPTAQTQTHLHKKAVECRKKAGFVVLFAVLSNVGFQFPLSLYLFIIIFLKPSFHPGHRIFIFPSLRKKKKRLKKKKRKETTCIYFEWRW